MKCNPLEHTWVRSEQHEAAPTNGRQWNSRFAYNRLVSTCATCGLTSRTGIRRISKASINCANTACKMHGKKVAR